MAGFKGFEGMIADHGFSLAEEKEPGAATPGSSLEADSASHDFWRDIAPICAHGGLREKSFRPLTRDFLTVPGHSMYSYVVSVCTVKI